MNGMTTEVSSSFGAILGRWLEPVLAPAGLGMWQIGVALISGLSAKEVVVSSFLVLFGVTSTDYTAGLTDLAVNLNQIGFGPLNAYALMVFSLLYTPCIATMATIKKEMNSIKYTCGILVFQLVIAWLGAVTIYQVGKIFL